MPDDVHVADSRFGASENEALTSMVRMGAEALGYAPGLRIYRGLAQLLRVRVSQLYFGPEGMLEIVGVVVNENGWTRGQAWSSGPTGTSGARRWGARRLPWRLCFVCRPRGWRASHWPGLDGFGSTSVTDGTRERASCIDRRIAPRGPAR